MHDNQTIRVMIVDDHTITRDGIKTLFLLYDDLVFAGEAGNGRDAIEVSKKIKPDVILMDLELPILDGCAATRQIKAINPEVKIIALTSFFDKRMVKDAIKAGACGYIIKNVSPDQLAQYIRDAFSGKTSLSPEATNAIIEEIKEPSGQGHDLTGQEIKILRMLSQGYSNKIISKELFISHNTVKFHISNLLVKLKASTRAEAAAIAVKNNLI
jgi:two-component system, NarL family, response regulator LiaR